jgi:hypothetical protein
MAGHVLRLRGCTPEPLGNYLKGLGVFRLIAEQADPLARAWWEDGFFRLRTKWSPEEVLDFFVQGIADKEGPIYSPAPIFAPWGGRPGFYKDGNEQARQRLDRIRALNPAGRFSIAQQTVEAIDAILQRNGWANMPKKKRARLKPEIVAELRNSLGASAIYWLDACLSLEDDVRFGFLYGTGGNEGSADITNNFWELIDVVKNTGSAVFDTFAAIAANRPLLFHWSELDDLDEQKQQDLRLLLDRMTYFGRAESWCRAEAHMTTPDLVEGITTEGPGRTHWQCVCLEDHSKPEGREYRDFTLEPRLAVVKDVKAETVRLLPRTKAINGKSRNMADAELLTTILESESGGTLLLRCLLRESGQDLRDGLERPIGTRWVHYAVPRRIYDLPSRKPRPQSRKQERINLVRYALNTATVGRPVLPAVTDTLLLADRFRSAVMALCSEPSPNLSGHEASGMPCDGNAHAHWWPFDEDNDGFIDHVMVWAPGGFQFEDVNALRRLTRLGQRGGRPDLLVTPTFVGVDLAYRPWSSNPEGGDRAGVTTFISATPYFCPLHLSHGEGKSGRRRPIVPVLLNGLLIRGVVAEENEVAAILEIVFDYAPDELASTLKNLEDAQLREPVPPRQYFPVIEPPSEFPPFPKSGQVSYNRFRGAFLKDPDAAFPFGFTSGLLVENGVRLIRAVTFARRRRRFQVKGYGRLFLLSFHAPRPPRPFALGDQSHFGFGLFEPAGRDRFNLNVLELENSGETQSTSSAPDLD